jgi:hypothetical protein
MPGKINSVIPVKPARINNNLSFKALAFRNKNSWIISGSNGVAAKKVTLFNPTS